MSHTILPRGVTRVLTLSLCLLPACSVSPARTIPKLPGPETRNGTAEVALAVAGPQDRQERQEREQKRQARERRRQADRDRRARSEAAHRDHRDDPDWPQDRRGRTRSRDQDRRKGDRDRAREHRDRDREHRDRHERNRDRRKRGRDRGPAETGRTYLLFSWADGDYDYKDGRGVQDNSARVYRLRTGATNRRGTGGGLDIKFDDVRHDAYSGSVLATGLEQLDIYPFFTRRLGEGRVHIPLRFGPYYNVLTASRRATGRETYYDNFGLRLEFEPTFNLMQGRKTTLQIYAALSAGAHVTYIDDELTGENYRSDGTTLGFEPGIRLMRKNLILSASYHVRESTIGESSRERDRNGVARKLPRVETELQGFMFTVGFRF